MYKIWLRYAGKSRHQQKRGINGLVSVLTPCLRGFSSREDWQPPLPLSLSHTPSPNPKSFDVPLVGLIVPDWHLQGRRSQVPWVCVRENPIWFLSAQDRVAVCARPLWSVRSQKWGKFLMENGKCHPRQHRAPLPTLWRVTRCKTRFVIVWNISFSAAARSDLSCTFGWCEAPVMVVLIFDARSLVGPAALLLCPSGRL